MQSAPEAAPNPPPPGWYPDPWQVAPKRWWDGMTWTGFTGGAPAPSPAFDTRYAGGYVAGNGGPTAVRYAAALPQARDDVRGGGVAILGFFGAIALSLLCAEAFIAAGVSSTSIPVMLAGQFGLWTGLTMAAYIVTHRRPGGSLADLGLRMPTGSEIGRGLGIGLVGFFIAMRVAAFLIGVFKPADPGSQSHLYLGPPSMTLILVSGALACIGAPFFEELFFRGIVQTVLTRRLGVSAAIVMQAALFGAAHFQLGMSVDYAIVRCGTVAVMGLFLGVLRQSTGRLGAGMVAHATNNTIVTVLMLIAFSMR